MFFLNETAYTDATECISLEESYLALADAMYAMSEANCSLLNEDFKCAVELSGLSEADGDAEHKRAGVLVRIKDGIIMFLRKVGITIASITRSIIALVKDLADQFRGLKVYMPSDADVIIQKTIELATKLKTIKITKPVAANKVDVESDEELLKNLTELTETAFKRLDAIPKPFPANPKGVHGWLNAEPVVNTAKNVSTFCGKMSSLTSQAYVNAAKQAETAEDAAVCRSFASFYSKYASLISKVTHKAFSFVVKVKE